MILSEGSIQPLQGYLVTQLEPICSAEPQALANYIVALLKHNETEEQLRKKCEEQLEDFLGDYTRTFVDSLFNFALPELQKPNNGSLGVSSGSVGVLEDENVNNVQEAIQQQQQLPPPPSSQQPQDKDTENEHKRPHIETKGEDNNNNNNNNNNNDDSKRRKREDDRDGNSRDRRGRDHNRDKDNRSYRDRERERERERDRERERERERDRERDVSKDGEQRGRMKEDLDKQNFGKGGRGKEREDESEPSSSTSSSTTALLPRNNRNPRFKQPNKPRARCKDYDERGFCMRGELCPYEHGTDHIVVQDVQDLRKLNMTPEIPVGDVVPLLPQPQLIPTFDGDERKRESIPNIHPSHQHNNHNFPNANINNSSNISSINNGNLLNNPNAPPFQNQGFPPRWRERPNRGGRSSESGQRSISPRHTQSGVPEHSVVLAGPRHHNGAPPLKEKPPMESNVDDDQYVPEFTNQKFTEENYDDREAENYDNNGVYGEGDKRSQFAKRPRFAHKTQNPSSLQNNTHQTSITIACLPPDVNTIENINGHFKQFGTVVNIHILATQGKAILQFKHPWEAQRAVRSPEAVFGNRFIKVFIAREEEVQSVGFTTPHPALDQNNVDQSTEYNTPYIPTNIPLQQQQTQSVHHHTQLTQPHHAVPLIFESKTAPNNINTTLVSVKKEVEGRAPSLTKPVHSVSSSHTTATATTTTTTTTITTHPSSATTSLDDKKTKDLKELQKQKESLRKSQIEQQKQMLDAMKKKLDTITNVKEKSELLKSFDALSKQLQDSMKKEQETLRAQLLNSKPLSSPSPKTLVLGGTSHLKSMKDIKTKEMLDKDLESLTVLQERAHLAKSSDAIIKPEPQTPPASTTTTTTSQNLEAIKNALESRVNSMGIDTSSITGRKLPATVTPSLGRGAIRPRGGAPPRGRGRGRGGAMKLDLRTTSIKISGLTDNMSKDLISNHFHSFGEVTSVTMLPNKEALVQFGDRHVAELAVSHGKILDGVTLNMQWHNNASISASSDSASNSLSTTQPTKESSPLISETKEEDEDDDEYARYYEEEEDDQERSWKH